VELTQALLGRIEAHDGELNALLTVTVEQALAAAKRSDTERAKGDYGVPGGGVLRISCRRTMRRSSSG
jgi:Asp-tRNA(Asn)/Glu-tRNA(Gln) amidotransferase A subunit family amidase